MRMTCICVEDSAVSGMAPIATLHNSPLFSPSIGGGCLQLRGDCRKRMRKVFDRRRVKGIYKYSIDTKSRREREGGELIQSSLGLTGLQGVIGWTSSKGRFEGVTSPGSRHLA